MRPRLRLIRTPAFRLAHPLYGRLLTAVRVGGYRAIDMILRRLHLPATRGRSSVHVLQSNAHHLHIAPTFQVVLQQEARPQRVGLRVLSLRESVRELMQTSVMRTTERVVQPAPLVRPAAMVTRVERQVLFPRVNVTLARQPGASAARRESVGPDGPPLPLPVRADPRAPRAAELRTLEPFSLPAQELSRVTDHVIRQLDRRVLSYRERTGRI